MASWTDSVTRLLLVDDSLSEADAIVNVLRGAGYTVRASREETLSDIEQLLHDQTWDLLICRDTVADLQVADVAALIQRLGKDLPCIVLISDKDKETDYYGMHFQDIIFFDDSTRLQFAVARELKNLFNRRLGRHNEQALRESEKRSRLLLESSREAACYIHEGMHIYVNSAYLKLFAYEEAEDICGLPVLDLIAVNDHHKFKSLFRQFADQPHADPITIDASCIKADGTGFHANIELRHASIEGEDCMQVLVRNKVALDATDADLQMQRDFDSLTGLCSRERFTDELEKAVFAATQGQDETELLYIALDEFQSMKEQVGLVISDNIIKSVAQLLNNKRAEDELLARYADQVFTVIVPGQDENEVEQRAESYLKTISDYVSHIGNKAIDVHCSIGIARISENYASINEVLDNADKACMQAQKEGGNQFVRYQRDNNKFDKAAASSRRWKTRLQKALDQDGFSLQFQPVVSLHGKLQEWYDVLLRLKQSDGSLLEAKKFIDYARQFRMMADIDKWIIRTALDRLAEHRKQFPRTRFFLRLSEQLLDEPEFCDWFRASLDTHGLQGDAVIFEISETTALKKIDRVKPIINNLKDIGCEFALAHFGSGIDFSNSLNMLDVNYLKINGTFVENLTKDPDNQMAIETIIEVTKKAGKISIAEFVSDANSLALLWRLGVDYAQGYYIYEPSDDPDYSFEDEDEI